jgi:hypothetical protein
MCRLERGAPAVQDVARAPLASVKKRLATVGSTVQNVKKRFATAGSAAQNV